MIRNIKSSFTKEHILLGVIIVMVLLSSCGEEEDSEKNLEIIGNITHIEFHDNTYMSVDFNEEEREQLLSLLNDITYYKSEEVSSEPFDGWGSSIVLFREDGSRVLLSNEEADVLEIDGYLYYFKEPHGVGEVVRNVLKRLHLPNLDEIEVISVSINDIDIVDSPYPRYIELDDEQRQEVLTRLEKFSKDYEAVEEPWYDEYDWIYSMYLSSEDEEFDLNIIDDNTIDVLGHGFYSDEPHNLVEFFDLIYDRKE